MTIDNENKSLLKHELLVTLSFFEPMNMEKLFIDISEEFSLTHNNLQVKHLKEVLTELEEQKLIRSSIHNEEMYWIKIYPKRRKNFKWLKNRILKILLSSNNSKT